MKKTPHDYTVQTYEVEDENTTGCFSSWKKRAAERLLAWKPEWMKRGWVTTVGLGFAAALFVCILNLILLIWTVASEHDAWSQVLNAYPSDNVKGIKNVYTGDCSVTSAASTWAHLAINILSSLLLAASNSAMQVLTAPSRDQIDKAHAKRRWVDIGVQSWRNLRNAGALRRLLWILLGVTTLPLHLMYNSVILHATSENNYAIVVADHSFLNGGYWSLSRATSWSDLLEYWGSPEPGINFLSKNKGLVQLDNADCISAYSRSLMSDYGNLLVVTNASVPQGHDSLLHAMYVLGTEDPIWICSSSTYTYASCDYANAIANADSWQQNGTTRPDRNFPDHTYSVEYCLAQPTPELCSVGVATSLLVVVLACNIIKAVCLFWTWRMTKLNPLVTIGDAISSFLEHPDETTKDCGVLEARSKDWKLAKTAPAQWKGRSRIGFHAASTSRWIVSSILFVAFWALCMVLLELGLRSYDNTDGKSSDMSFLIAQGIGSSNFSAIDLSIFGELSFAPLVLLANLPQLLISLLYILYNDLMTRLSLSREWTAFSRSPQPLRVSIPHGSQVGTHFLSLPWKLAVPLLIVMTILHWLVSQSIGLVYITGFDYAIGGRWPVPLGTVALYLGWSPFALILSLAVGGLLILVLWGSGFFSYGSSMPLVQGCSVAISAACHPLEEDRGAANRLLRYGGVREVEKNSEIVAHASFSSGAVTPLRAGQLYE